MAYALRRTSARLVAVLAIGGLVWAIYRSLRPVDPLSLRLVGVFLSAPARATSQDVAAAALGLVGASVLAAVLWYERSIRR
jgi:hypothetical protein